MKIHLQELGMARAYTERHAFEDLSSEQLRLMAHHLVASIPWYQQIALHHFMVGLLSEKQRRQFLLPPGLGFPQLLWRVVRDANAFSRAAGRTT